MANTKTRRKLIAGNWKMNHGPRETEVFFTKLKELASTLNPTQLTSLTDGSVQAALYVPAISLTSALRASATLPFPIEIGSQNTHWEKKGAFTGEVSTEMLNEIGIRSSLVGHSERRQFFGETDETVRKRGEHLLDQGLQVILCIGETKAERDQGATSSILLRQLNGALPHPEKGMARYLDGRLVLAYEPVWAIGTGVNATPSQAEEAHAFIRKTLADGFGQEAANKTLLLYGGSVTPENIETLLNCPNVDGALVGGASLKPEGFLSLLKAGSKRD